jgi:hypothetical protein
MKWIMGFYQFKDSNTNEEWEDMMSIASKDEYLKANPHIKQVPTGFTIVTGVGDNRQKGQSDGFKEVLSKIGEKFPGSPLSDEYVTKSNKEVKTAQVHKKHIDAGVKKELAKREKDRDADKMAAAAKHDVDTLSSQTVEQRKAYGKEE